MSSNPEKLERLKQPKSMSMYASQGDMISDLLIDRSLASAEIDRLQRENEALREDRYKLACAITGGEDAPGLLDSTPTSEIVEIAQHAHRMHQDDIARAEAAEAKVKRQAYLLEKVAPAEFSKSWLPPQDYEMIRNALASTGGDHHGN